MPSSPCSPCSIVGTAFASHFMDRFGVYLDPSMLRNVLRTDAKEARELFSLVAAAAPAAVGRCCRCCAVAVRLAQRRWTRAALVRAGALLAALVVIVGAMLRCSSLLSLMRNQKELRYLITPANYLWSIGTVLAAQAKGAAGHGRPSAWTRSRARTSRSAAGPRCWCSS